MSAQQLGLDPTVRVLSDADTEKLTGSAQLYPSVIIPSGGDDTRQWCTIGPPLWTSASLLGRGTHVWRVREYAIGIDQQPVLKGSIMLLKTAWRRSEMMAEADIYSSINHPPQGLAGFVCGGDVIFNGVPITVQNMCYTDSHLTQGTSVLHRIVLSAVGKSLWEYTSDLELLLGYRDIIQAHRTLTNMGILHRDISPGNVLLTDAVEVESDGPKGFITDLGLASITNSPLTSVNISNESVYQRTQVDDELIGDKTVLHDHGGIKSTGKLQFMSRRKLLQEHRCAEPFVHVVSDDLESFIWVMSYSVMRSIYKRASTAPDEDTREQASIFLWILNKCFSKDMPFCVSEERTSLAFTLIFPFDADTQLLSKQLMSTALISLFQGFRRIIWTTILNEEDDAFPSPITHDILLDLVQRAIDTLKAE